MRPTADQAREQLTAIKARLRVPAIAAPMFLVSGPDLVIAACKAGIAASFPTLNARPASTLIEWLDRITGELGAVPEAAPWIPNLVLHRSNPRRDEDIEIVLSYRPQLVITALGKPDLVADRVHAYGGLVLADVNSVRMARVALDNGADGLILLCAGAGGHTGQLSPFAFVAEVRRFFSGPLVVAGGLMSGRDIAAIELLGADLAYLGTRFIACEESMADGRYRDMLVAANADDIVLCDKFTGVPANYLKPSIEAAGIDLDTWEKPASVSIDQREDAKAWRDIWSAGHGTGAVDRIRTVGSIADQLAQEYRAARG